jgi:hypothetical protein
MIGSSIVSSPEDGLDKLAKHARGVLILLAAVQIGGGVIVYIAGGIPSFAAMLVECGLGVVFGLLAIWARKDPLSAVIVGLGIWVLGIAGQAIAEPASLFSGLLVKAIVIVMFINGISTGRTYNELARTLGRTR